MTPGPVPAGWWTGWSPEPPMVLLAVLVCSAYALGVERLWRGRAGRGVPRRSVAAFAAGVALAGVAVASPLDRLASQLLSAHMVQHLVLVLGAAPLLAAGRPQLVLPAALPPGGRRRLQQLRRATRVRGRSPSRSGALQLAAAAHIAALWAWHAPVVYELALRDDRVHLFEHLFFAGTAMAVWLALLNPDRRSRLGHGTAVLCLGAILVAGGLLGALLTFAGTPLYPHYAATGAWGLSPLEDQQLAGVLMWVPSAVFYGVVAAWLLRRWLELVEAWTRAREREHDATGAPRRGPPKGGRVVS